MDASFGESCASSKSPVNDSTPQRRHAAKWCHTSSPVTGRPARPSPASNSDNALAIQKALVSQRVQAAAESVARLQKKISDRKTQTSMHDSPPSALSNDSKVREMAQRVAVAADALTKVRRTAAQQKEDHSAAERQVRRSEVPSPEDVDAVGPEWIQQKMQERLWRQTVVIEDSVQVSSDYVLPLTCPLSGERLQVPVRGQHCAHIECFDLQSLRHAPPVGWRCPMVGCGSSVVPELLQKDLLVEALLWCGDPAMYSIVLSSDLANTQTEGSEEERVQTLAELTFASQPEAPLSPETSPVMDSDDDEELVLIEISDAIEVIESESEVSPVAKRSRGSRDVFYVA